MALIDENHDVARIIKDLEERVTDLERSGGSQSTPNLLRSETDRATVKDVYPTVTTTDLATGEWDGDGWRTSTWGSYD